MELFISWPDMAFGFFWGFVVAAFMLLDKGKCECRIAERKGHRVKKTIINYED